MEYGSSMAISWDIRHIQTMIRSHGVEVVHVHREGNNLIEFLNKSLAHFVGTERQQYQNMHVSLKTGP